MGRGRRKPVVISPQAQQDIEFILEYLKENWTQRIIDHFLSRLEAFYTIVSAFPHIFAYYSKTKNIRNYAITKYQIIYYRNKRRSIEIITIFDNRQSPSKLRKALNK